MGTEDGRRRLEIEDMRTRQQTTLLLTIALLTVMTLVWLPGDNRALAHPRGTPITDMDLIHNGTFDQDKTAWATNPVGTHVGADYGRPGPGMQIWPEFSDNYGYVFQETYLPSQTTVATLSFDYRFVPGSGAALGFFTARVATDSDTIATLLDITPANYPSETWQMVNVSLSAGELAALNAARAAGQHVYVLIELYAQFLYANVDNVAFQVSGQMTYPALSGSIAYVGLDNSGYAKTVKRIDPDGSNRQTLWTHPSAVPQTNAIHDVAWKPDASELAFSSNHETLYSAFHSDVYGIRSDGSGLRRITNPPCKAKLDAGGYQMGTVRGRVHNNYGSVTLFFVYVEGAKDVVSVDVGYFGDETGFTVPDVADLGTGLHHVVFTWASGSKANCREYAAAVVDVMPGQTVDAGTLTFNGNCGTYDSDSISWKRDGAEIGVDVITPRRFLATGEAIGRELFSAPLTADELAWSPVDDRILYRKWSTGGDSGIYLTTAAGGAGSKLVDDAGALWVTPAWLPDGSGFVYTLDNYLYQYDFASSQVSTLAQFHNEYVFNPGLSPDGNCIVFERQSTGTPIQHDLWIMNRNNPAEMWPLTDDGRSSDPDWSRQEPKTGFKIYLPVSLRRRQDGRGAEEHGGRGAREQGERRRQGEGERGRQGELDLSPCLPVSLSENPLHTSTQA